MGAAGEEKVTRTGWKIRPKGRRKTQINVRSCLRFSQINSERCSSCVTEAERVQPEEGRRAHGMCEKKAGDKAKSINSIDKHAQMLQ